MVSQHVAIMNERTTGATSTEETRPHEPTHHGEEPRISAQRLRKTFGKKGGERVRALDDVSLNVSPGEFVVLLGPSGCGKTTLLRSIAGLETPESGEITISGKTVYSSSRKINLPAERRGINMMFQSYALWPHMTVFDNVAYPLRSHKVAKNEIADRVTALLGRMGIPELVDRHPSELSGGQQQRVALTRALAVDPSCVMFDEPLSNVDAKVREQLRVELVEMHRRMGFSAVYVTHDQVEAMQLADRLVVMRHGAIEQQGTPEEIYRAPRTRYVADFIGQCNQIEGDVRAVSKDTVTVTTALGTFEVEVTDGHWSEGDPVVLIARLENVRVTDDDETGPNHRRAIVRARMFAGSTTEYLVELDGGHTLRLAVEGHRLPMTEGEEITVLLAPGSLQIVPQEDEQ